MSVYKGTELLSGIAGPDGATGPTGPAGSDATVTFADNTDAENGTVTNEVMSPATSRHMLDTKPSGVPVSNKTGSYNLADGDKGTLISITTGGITVPNTLSVGTTISIWNDSGSDQTITEGSGLTMYWAQDASTGDRTLAGRGLCTVTMVASSVAVIGGTGLS